MRERIRSHLSYANVVVTILAFIVLGGISYAATGGNFILGKSNTASSKSTLAAPIADKALAVTNTSSKAGATALGLNVASGHPPFTVNSGTRVAGLNADKLDGQDSTAFAQVRDFKFSINTVSDPTTLLSFRGLTLTRGSEVFGGTLRCRVWVSSNADGRWDGSVVGGQPTEALTAGGFTPVTNDQFGNIASTDQRGLFHIVFINDDTGRVVNVDYSIYGYPENGGCRWQGTAYAR